MTRALARHAQLGQGARQARRLGIFGGSFDPPHGGHLCMAREALRARRLDHVLWVPAAEPPHKPDRRLAPAAERVHMLELLLAEEPGERHTIWTVELERAGTSYTIDTLRSLVAELRTEEQGGPSLFLILGMDNLAGLPRWRRVDEILELASAIVLPRGAPAPSQGELERGFADAAVANDALARDVLKGVIDCPPVDISSSEVRAALRRGEGLGGSVPASLREYLNATSLYRES